MKMLDRPRRGGRGAAMVFALALVFALAVIGIAIIKYAGRDRIAAAKMSVKERGLACADAGIQYGRRYFGCNYKTTGNWNQILSGTVPGRYDPQFLGDAYPTSVSSIPMVLKGDRTGSGTLDPGTDLDGDGNADFWVSIRDDDDERPLGAADDRRRDNNLMVILRSECINPAWATEVGGRPATAVVEVRLAYVPGSTSPYGKATSSSDFPEASASGPTVVTTVANCD
jgi:hypothetical protein